MLLLVMVNSEIRQSLLIKVDEHAQSLRMASKRQILKTCLSSKMYMLKCGLQKEYKWSMAILDVKVLYW